MTDQNVSLRIIVKNPPVRFAVQRGKAELVEATSASAKQQVFEFSIRARNDGSDSAPIFSARVAKSAVPEAKSGPRATATATYNRPPL